ncbi:hypothetical protein [Paenibacillus sp. NPDC093718]|uniref:hypothetical protein n=1 Tax=Paenibacillus sp. NPDC093718 TaxID=3390601 RepID=UPI003D072EEF
MSTKLNLISLSLILRMIELAISAKNEGKRSYGKDEFIQLILDKKAHNCLSSVYGQHSGIKHYEDEKADEFNGLIYDAYMSKAHETIRYLDVENGYDIFIDLLLSIARDMAAINDLKAIPVYEYDTEESNVGIQHYDPEDAYYSPRTDRYDAESQAWDDHIEYLEEHD